MNRCAGLLTLCVQLVTPIGFLQAQSFDSTFTRDIAPGVVHRRLVVNAAPWNINVVVVDLRTAGLVVQSAHAHDTFFGREAVSDIARRRTARLDSVLVAINADFFRLSDGEPTNNFVVEGEWWRGVHDWTDGRTIRTQFAMTLSGRPLIDRFNWSGIVSTSRYPSFALDGLNVRPASDAVSLFTPRFGPYTPRDSIGRSLHELELIPLEPRGGVRRFRIADTVRSGGGSALEGRVMLVGGRTTRSRLSALGPPGTILRLQTGVTPDRGPLRTLVGGLPRLALHGRGIADTALADAEGANTNLRLRHPRSAVGFSRDSTALFLVTVDGRQPTSAGMDLVELSRLMLSLGAYEALNLDGGGSTTMVAGGEVVNRPSDAGGPRTVANALLIVRRPPK